MAFRDPCLLTTEGCKLAAWLEAVADGWPDVDATEFIEPLLEFRRISGPFDPPIIRMIFRLEARPPWQPLTDEDDDWDSACLDLELTPDALRAAATNLRTDLSQYPER